MKKMVKFYPLAPVVFSLYLIVSGFRTFYNIVLPKEVYLWGRNPNPFLEPRYYYYYPTAFLISLITLVVGFLLYLYLATKKEKVNVVLALLLFSLISIYIVNVNSGLVSGLVTKIAYESVYN